jgi:hypothetical protein
MCLERLGEFRPRPDSLAFPNLIGCAENENHQWIFLLATPGKAIASPIRALRVTASRNSHGPTRMIQNGAEY